MTDLWIFCTVIIVLQSARCSSAKDAVSRTTTTCSARLTPARRRLSSLKKSFPKRASVEVMLVLGRHLHGNLSLHPEYSRKVRNRIEKSRIRTLLIFQFKQQHYRMQFVNWAIVRSEIAQGSTLHAVYIHNGSRRRSLTLVVWWDCTFRYSFCPQLG